MVGILLLYPATLQIRSRLAEVGEVITSGGMLESGMADYDSPDRKAGSCSGSLKRGSRTCWPVPIKPPILLSHHGEEGKAGNHGMQPPSY